MQRVEISLANVTVETRLGFCLETVNRRLKNALVNHFGPFAAAEEKAGEILEVVRAGQPVA